MSADLGRTPPHDVLAEQSVLGGALLARRSLDEVAGILKPSDFYRPGHEAIFGVIVALHRRGEPADVVTVAGELGKRGDLERVGGPVYLHTLISTVPTAANAGYYARIVREASVNRELIERGTRIVQLGFEGGDAARNVTAAQNEVLDLASPEEGHGRWIGEIVEEVMEAAENGGPALPTLSWGYGDEMPDMPCGRMVTLAGRPGLGKSTAGLDAARHAAIHLGLPTIMFSLEMSQAEVGARTAAAEAKIPLPHVQKGEMTAEDWQRWARKMGLVMDAPLWVDDFPRSDPGYIRSECRRLVREKGPLGLVVVDYLQLMEDNGAPASKSRQQTVSEFSRSLTILAKELETAPVLSLAQLNRGPEQRNDKKPAMSDLRESGSIEQDSAQVILVHREDAYEKESPRAGEVDLIVAKNRGGPTTTVTLASQLHVGRFVAMAIDRVADSAPPARYDNQRNLRSV